MISVISYLVMPPPFFSTATATTDIYTLSLHDALPISRFMSSPCPAMPTTRVPKSSGTIKDLIIRRKTLESTLRSVAAHPPRSEEHTSELQSRRDLVCRLLLEKKNKTKQATYRARTDYP